MRVRLALIALFLAAAFAAPPAPAQQGGKKLAEIVFDKETGWRTVGRDDQGKEGVILEVDFKLKLSEEAKARPGRYRIVIEEDKRRVKEVPLDLLPDQLTAVLAVDISNSMELVDNEKTGERRIDAAKRAAKVFFKSMGPRVDCGLILFDDKIKKGEAIPPCGDPKKIAEHRAKLLRLVDQAEPRGGTAYLDALTQAIDMLKGVHGRKAIVLVTDGVDLHSKAKPAQVIEQAKQYNIPIWTIGIGELGKSLRIATVLALDHSGSMKEPADDNDQTPKIKALHEAANLFIDKLHPQADLALLPFSTQVGVVQRFTKNVGDRAMLKGQINALEPAGETAFLSAAFEAVGTLEAYNPPGMRLVVVLTDGKDNSSRHRMEDVIARAQDGRVRLYMLALGREKELDSATMQKLAKDTNGSYLHARNKAELIAIFDQLSIDLDDRGIDEAALRRLAHETKGGYKHARDLRNLSGIFQELAQAVQETYKERFASARQAMDGTARSISIYVVENREVVEVDAMGNVVHRTREEKVSDESGFDYNVRGVVVPQMHGLVYLAFLAGLGLLIAAPAVLRRRRASEEG